MMSKVNWRDEPKVIPELPTTFYNYDNTITQSYGDTDHAGAQFNYKCVHVQLPNPKAKK